MQTPFIFSNERCHWCVIERVPLLKFDEPDLREIGMPTTRKTEIQPKKLLIITSSGGGGLIQTANAKHQEAVAKNPDLIVIRRDLLKDWVWSPIGNYFINFWNQAQIKGNIPAQMLCVYGQFFIDYFLHIPVFIQTLKIAFSEEIDHVIDTQPIGTSAIIRALRIYNKRRGKNVRLEKVLVDLPTKKATHFFRPIRKLSKRSRKLLKLTTIQPLLDDGETAEQFWRKTCGLKVEEINFEEVYVRQAFRQYKGKEKTLLPMEIQIHYKNKEELSLMKKCFKRGPIPYSVKEEEVHFTIEPDDKMITVLLGSQPAKEATLQYVKELVQIARAYPNVKTDLFVFCADHVEGEATLFRKVADFVESIDDFPKNFSVIPFSFQTEHSIAPLFYRSDITCTRSGGQTAMELMCVSTGEIWIHSEAKKGQDLLKGISGWESASAVYLQKLCGAKIVTPDRCLAHAHARYQISNEAVRATFGFG